MPEVPEISSNFTVDDVAILVAVALVSIVAYLLLRLLLTRVGAKLVSRANPRLATLLTQQSFFTSIALLAPVLIIALVNPFLRQRFGWAADVYSQFVRCYLIAVLGLVVYKLLSALEELAAFERDPAVAGAIHLIFRGLRYLTIAITSVLALGVFTDIQVDWVLGWLGVAIAAGSIVFSDMLYNAVASVLLKGRKLVVVGDWLEIPALQVNGVVQEIGSLLIQVRNWDNSLVTVSPRYLLTNTFRNWQQMIHLGRRRIYRYLYIDVMTVRLLDDDLCDSIRQLPEMAKYLAERTQEFGSAQVALSTLTNAALYRAYLMNYLATHPKVARDNILRVTNEDAVGHGLPVLMLAFLTETQDVPYRLLDAEIYEHALAVAPRFGLQIFQSPLGANFTR